MADIHKPAGGSIVNIAQVDVLVYDSLQMNVVLGYGSGITFQTQKNELDVVYWASHVVSGYSPGVGTVSGSISSYITNDGRFKSSLQSVIPNWPLRTPRGMVITVQMQENSETPGQLLYVATGVVTTGGSVGLQQGSIGQNTFNFKALKLFDTADVAQFG